MAKNYKKDTVKLRKNNKGLRNKNKKLEKEIDRLTEKKKEKPRFSLEELKEQTKDKSKIQELEKDIKILKANTEILKDFIIGEVRLCPMWAWRRSLKIFGQVFKVMDYVEENHNYKYVFLTLTVRNCYGEDLRNTLNLMT